LFHLRYPPGSVGLLRGDTPHFHWENSEEHVSFQAADPSFDEDTAVIMLEIGWPSRGGVERSKILALNGVGSKQFE
jgi:hypothetical protein